MTGQAPARELPYVVGDQVWIYLSGFRQDIQGAVTRIGRTLVQVKHPDGRLVPYRIDGQRRSDGHTGSFQTEAQRAEQDRRRDAVQRLARFGVTCGGRAGWVGWPTDNLIALGDAAAELAPFPPPP